MKSQQGLGLESKLSHEILGYFSHQPLKGGFPHQQIRRFLVLANFAQGKSAGTEPLLARATLLVWKELRNAGVQYFPSGGLAGGLGTRVMQQKKLYVD